MAGSYASRFVTLARVAIVAIAAAATATYDSVVSCWRSSYTMVANWVLVAVVHRLPRLTADWLRPELALRVKKDGTIAMRSAPKRRPTVFPGWRMAPSV
jgi:hypothetical protein